MIALISYGIGYTRQLDRCHVPGHPAAPRVHVGEPAGHGGHRRQDRLARSCHPFPSGWTRLVQQRRCPRAVHQDRQVSRVPVHGTLAATSVAAGFVAAYPAATVGSQLVREQRRQRRHLDGDIPRRGHLRGDRADGRGRGRSGDESDATPAYATLRTYLHRVDGRRPRVRPGVIPTNDADSSRRDRARRDHREHQQPDADQPRRRPGGLRTLYAGFLVLTITGSPPPLYAVTATVAQSPTAITGMALTVKALTGAATVAEIVSGGATADVLR